MHDFYSSHLHTLPPHITSSSHNPSSSPVSHVSHLHQLHNTSLNSFPHHPSVTSSLPVNASPPNHSVVYSPSSITHNSENQSESNQDENHNNSHTQTHTQSGNDSPSSTGVHYSVGVNLPPTPNSLVTMMGPNSGN